MPFSDTIVALTKSRQMQKRGGLNELKHDASPAARHYAIVPCIEFSCAAESNGPVDAGGSLVCQPRSRWRTISPVFRKTMSSAMLVAWSAIRSRFLAMERRSRQPSSSPGSWDA